MARHRIIDNEYRIYSKWFDSSIYKLFRKKDNSFIIEKYLKKNPKTDVEVAFLADFIRKHNFSSVFSVGCGTCVFEYFLKEKLPDVNIVSGDIINKYISGAKKFFPEVNPFVFDMTKDDIPAGIDLVFGVSSFFALNTGQLEVFLKRLHSAKVKYVIIFFGGKRVPLGKDRHKKEEGTYGYGHDVKRLFKMFKHCGFSRNVVQCGSYQKVFILRRI
jgi:hypothetical protein